MNNVLKSNLRNAYDRKAHERESHGKEQWKLDERSHFLSLLRHEDKRFFSFYTDDQLQEVVTQVFDLHSFKRVEFSIGQELHFQSCILRKREE